MYLQLLVILASGPLITLSEPGIPDQVKTIIEARCADGLYEVSFIKSRTDTSFQLPLVTINGQEVQLRANSKTADYLRGVSLEGISILRCQSMRGRKAVDIIISISARSVSETGKSRIKAIRIYVDGVEEEI